MPRFLDLVTAIETTLGREALSRQGKLNASIFMNENSHFRIGRADFESLLEGLSRSSIPQKYERLLSHKSIRTTTDRRSISLGILPTHSSPLNDSLNTHLSIDTPSVRGHKSQIQYFEEQNFILDDQRVDLQTKLSIYETQLKELQENDSKRLQDIEEIEQELEATQQELHERRMKQNEELRRSREAAATIEAEITRRYSSTGLDSASDNELKDFESPFSVSGTDDEDCGSVNIRLHRLEEEKRTYVDVLELMKKERVEYLTLIEQLKEQLAELQNEIVSLKAHGDEAHLQTLPTELPSDFPLRDEEAILEKAFPIVAEQRQHLSEALYKRRIFSNNLCSRMKFVVGTLGICLLGAAVLSNTASPCSEILNDFKYYHQTLKLTIESWIYPRTH